MKKRFRPYAFVCLSISVAVLSSSISAIAQDIPLFSQKLTNAFIYNPAIAGHTFGSITFSYKQNYGKVNGAPRNYFLSVHAPFAKHRFGMGANVFQEDVNFLRNTYGSVAFAYHLPFSRFTKLSFGVSGEYNSIGLNGTSTSEISDPEYLALRAGDRKQYDFSAGAHFQNRFLKAGVAANRLSSTWIEDSAAITNHFSSFLQGLIPMRGGEDMLEPYVAFRKLSDLNQMVDVGLFYTYANRITIGASYRSGGMVSASLAFRFSKYLMVGYSRETLNGNIGGYIGSANEYTLRYDFNDESYKERFRSDYKAALSYRHKTISGPSKKGARNPKQMHRQQKRLAPYSPNRRYQNIKKLSNVHHKRKPSYKKPRKYKRRRR